MATVQTLTSKPTISLKYTSSLLYIDALLDEGHQIEVLEILMIKLKFSLDLIFHHTFSLATDGRPMNWATPTQNMQTKLYPQLRLLPSFKELKACFGNGNSAFNWNLQERMKKMAESNVHKRKWRITGFLSSGVRNLIQPWKWQEVFGIAVKLIVGSVSKKKNSFKRRNK